MAEILQIEVGLMSNFNMFIADTTTRVCAIVDPAYEVDRLLREAKARNWTVAAVLLTHTHHDHIDGVEAMVEATGAKVYAGAAELENVRHLAPGAEFVGLSGGEKIAIGGEHIEVLPTPGHTVAGRSYLVDGNVMTGDTLFIGGCGRTDFPGGDPRVLYQSLQLLAALPEETRVYPGHDYGPTPTATLAHELRENPYLRCRTFEEFRARRQR
jgi:glyoxylase-like metal-dependent hydrolase (beta-lactamase superfamily II)